VGLSKKTLLQAIKSLEEQNIILTQRRRSQEKGDEPTSYRLHVRSEAAGEVSTPPVGEKLHHGGGGRSAPPPWGKNSPTQETVMGETDLDLSNFERSHDNIEETGEERRDQPRAHAAATTKIESVQTAQAGSPPEPASLKDLIARRRQVSGGPRRGRVVGSSDDRERLRAFLGDFALELGDEAPLASTITRTLNIFKTANLPPERWGDMLYQARGLTQEHTAQIRKTAGDGGDGLRRKNKMPYFLATLEHLVGLRPAADTPRQEPF
jgi:hypothetical protein